MQPRAVCRSRGRSYLVALRDGCCNNDKGRYRGSTPIACSREYVGLYPRPRSRPGSHPALLRSPPPPFPSPLPLRPRPHDRSRPRSHPRPRYLFRSRPRLQSCPRPRSLLPIPLTRLPPQYDALEQTTTLANGTVGCPQVPPFVCRDGDACGMKVPAVKQKRITAEDVLLPSLPSDVETRWSVSSTCALPV